MTYFYTPLEQRHLKAGFETALDLVMCGDGNYRTREEKHAFEKSRAETNDGRDRPRLETTKGEQGGEDPQEGG